MDNRACALMGWFLIGRRLACTRSIGFCRSGLVRELPGTGSKACACGTSGAASGSLRSPSRTSEASPGPLPRPPGRSPLCWAQ
ncbi:hypothetical protein F4W70_13755 [Pseudomonas cannabina]|nr:hypothetical protein F4W70_13755 [Pseudomonas cannabina]